MSRPIIDLTGKKFGRLTVISCIGRRDRQTFWKCQCDCGNVCETNSTRLTSGATQSCGCLAHELFLRRITKHGQSHTRLYKQWKGMKDRCLNPNSTSYKNYGGRGITICDEWVNDFESFYEWAMRNGYDSNAPKHGFQLDRIDNDGNYCPSNCRWATPLVQAHNKRKHKAVKKGKPVNLIDKNGNVIKRFKTITEASNEIGCTISLITRVCQGKNKTAKGMIFKFAETEQ